MKTHLKYTLLFNLLFAPFFFSLAAQATEDYQVEVGISTFRFEDSGDLEINQSLFEAAHYFSPVSTKNNPYNEASFIERVGNITFLVQPGDMEMRTEKADTLSKGAKIQFMQAGNPFFAQIFYAKTKRDFDRPPGQETDKDTYSLDFGLFLENAFLLSMSYQYSRSEISQSGSVERELKDKRYSIDLKRVKKLNHGKAVNIELSLARDEFDNPTEDGSNNIAKIAGDYYFNQRISLGGKFGLDRGDDKNNEGESYGLTTTVFLNPYFSMQADFNRFFAKNAGVENSKRFGAGISLRF